MIETLPVRTRLGGWVGQGTSSCEPVTRDHHVVEEQMMHLAVIGSELVTLQPTRHAFGINADWREHTTGVCPGRLDMVAYELIRDETRSQFSSCLQAVV